MSKEDILDSPSNLLTVQDIWGGPDKQVWLWDSSAQQFAARLRKVAKERRKWAQKAQVSCYRVYDADLPDYALAIDCYHSASPQSLGDLRLHIAEYKAPSQIDPEKARRRFEDALVLTQVIMGVAPEKCFAKERRREKGGSQYAEKRSPYRFQIEENGHRFEVDLNRYLDTGIFLDHRDTRQLLTQLAPGARFLNLFAYTGTATVYAAAGKACATTTVDLSNTYLAWAQRNMELNGFTGDAHSYYCADTMAWLKDAQEQGLGFDLVFVDPPTFSNSKSLGEATWDVQRDYLTLLTELRPLLGRRAQVVFSCNLRSFKFDQDAVEALGFRVENLTTQTIPADFERNSKIHQCYLLSTAD